MPAIGKSKVKTYSKTNTAKKVLSDSKGEFTWETEKGAGRPKRKKVYTTKFSDAKAKAKKAMTSDKAYALPFPETFRQAKAKGDKTFRWKSKQYHTKTKEELETGKSEKERFDRAAEAKKAAPEKKGFFSKIATKLRGGYETQEGYEKAKVGRKKAKRIANLEARKAAGKSYSKKNLAALKAS